MQGLVYNAADFEGRILTTPTQPLSHKQPLVTQRSAMNHLTTVHSTPLDYARTCKTRNKTSAPKSQSGTSSFSLKDQLRSLRRKSTPSPSKTHHVALSGLKSDRQARGANYFPLLRQIGPIKGDSTSSDPTQTLPQKDGDRVFATAFGNVRSGWLQPPNSVSFCHC